MEIIKKARAKINITLDVIGKFDNGYHDMEMIMHQLTLCDDIHLKKQTTGITIDSNDRTMPLDERNLAYKAADAVFSAMGIEEGVSIYIEKRIPIEAGLAGGSSDAAQVIIGLNELYNLGMSQQEMIDIGVKIGADVPFCIMGGCALAKGIGERLTPLKGSDLYVLLSKPNRGVLTKLVFENLDWKLISEHPDTEKVITLLKEGKDHLWPKMMVNVLETVTLSDRPDVLAIKKWMEETDALGVLMSGSGPTVFGVYQSRDACEKAYQILKKENEQTFLTKLYNGGKNNG